jgi:hypothetical protein
MAMKKKTKYLNAHPGCHRGPKCRHCTWDTFHISVSGAHAKCIRGHRGQYRGDTDGAIDDFLATLKLEARRLLWECAKETPALRQFHLTFSQRESEVSMPHNTIEIDGAIGKTVEKINVTNESDFRVITVRFADRTAIHFTRHPRIEVEPELVDWTTGDGEALREYPIIREHEQ